ncbi:MAG: MFS transporter [Chloroflexota bacterium]|nr:MFS transporter [Chloroflexota bacterium]
MTDRPERPPISIGRILLYSAGSVGAGAFYAFNNFVLPFLLKGLGAGDLMIGLLSSTRSIEGALIQPTVGTISDRLWTRLGRRRPFMVVGIPLSAAFLVVAASSRDLVSLAIAIVLFSLFFNAALDPYTALLPDISPVRQRGLVSGISTGIQLASQVAFLLLIFLVSEEGVPSWTYFVVAAVMIVGFAVTVVGVPERRDVAELSERLGLRAYARALAEHTQAMRYLGTIFVYQFGFSAVLPYLGLFIQQDIGQSEQTAFVLQAATLLLTALSAVAFGRLADRNGTKLVMLIGWALLAVAAVGGTVITTLAQTVVVVVVAGIGNGAATAVKWPLLTTLIPPHRSGVFAGLMAAADSIAIPLSVVVAAELFLPRIGYRGIFALLAINMVVALVLLSRFVKVPPPRREPKPAPA